jgi:glycosyltransferase involved in cell wall biosynthesis
MKILHLVRAGPDSSLARDLSLVLESPLDETAVEVLPWKHRWDPRPLWRLRRLVLGWQPHTVHVWGLPALRAFRLALGRWRGRVVVNRPLSETSQCGAWDRWLLRGADRILVGGMAEAAHCGQAGVPADRLRVVPPGIAEQPSATSGDSTVVCAGALEPHLGFWDALWALDILRFVHEDIELVIAGEGPERSRLERFAANAGLSQRVRMVGSVPDRSALLSSATVVWVPSRTDYGQGAVLEAMAAGRPVIASRWPTLAELVVDGQTGWLIEPGNKMELAQKTRRLMDDPALRRSMGEAARRRVAEHFGATHWVGAWRHAWNE